MKAFLLLVLPLVACATGPVRPPGTVVHIRALAGASNSALAVAELLDDGSAPPALWLYSIALGRPPQVMATATVDEAGRAARAVRDGAALLDVLPGDLLEARDLSGLGPPGPGQMLPASVQTAAGPGRIVMESRPAPPGITWALVFRQEDIGVPLAEPGPGEEPLASLHVLGPELAAAELAFPSGSSRVRDVVPLDLGRAAGLILVARAEAQPSERMELLARAEAAAPREPAVPYARAVALARSGASREAASQLARALELGGEPYRIKARAEPLFRAPAYQALLAPRSIEGSNRAGGKP